MSEHLRHLPNLYEECFPTEKLTKKIGSSQMDGCSVSECEELIDIVSYSVLKRTFWARLNEKYPEIFRRALRNLLPYPVI